MPTKFTRPTSVMRAKSSSILSSVGPHFYRYKYILPLPHPTVSGSNN
jgi:hypothetical protein